MRSILLLIGACLLMGCASQEGREIAQLCGSPLGEGYNDCVGAWSRAPQQQAPAYFQQNPLGALGFVLQSTAAGISAGQPQNTITHCQSRRNGSGFDTTCY